MEKDTLKTHALMLLNMIKDMKDKGYEAETIVQSIEVNLKFNKFE
jgi:hypothetical protein